MMGPYSWRKLKEKNKKISMITCYDYSFAGIINDTNIDIILVGDSSENVIFGNTSTIDSNAKKLTWLTEGVRKGAPDKFIVCDIPFGLMQTSDDNFFKAVKKMISAGANAIKIEGVKTYSKKIKGLAAMGVPVMGHLGLTPQHIHQYGGFKVQGKTPESKDLIMKSALKLQKLGVFALVLECVPTHLATAITQELNIPTIGIGAGSKVDGQVLVLQDVLGMNPKFKPKFVRSYFNGYEKIKESVDKYVNDVQNQAFPGPEESYES